MRPPFPGMDPWLESPTLWPDVHNSLITSIRDVLAPRLRPRYFVGVESRTTLLTGLDVDRVYQPDVAIHATGIARPRRRDRAWPCWKRPRCRPYSVVGADRARRSKRHSSRFRSCPAGSSSR